MYVMSDEPLTKSSQWTVLVCGGRKFDQRDFLFRKLDEFDAHTGIALVITGGATGADALAVEWAKQRNKPVRVYHADWRKYGFSAGPKRNQQMLDEGKPEAVIAFPGGRGTADMVRRAQAACLEVYQHHRHGAGMLSIEPHRGARSEPEATPPIQSPTGGE